MIIIVSVLINLFTLTLGASDATNLENENITTNEEIPITMIEDYSAPIFAKFEKNMYLLNEIISIDISIDEEYSKEPYTYSFNGFTLIGSITSTEDGLSLALQYDGAVKAPTFELQITTKSGDIKTGVYGYRTDDGLFISRSDTEDATRSAFAYKVSSNKITIDEYYTLMENMFSDENKSRSIDCSTSDMLSCVNDCSSFSPTLVEGYAAVAGNTYMISGTLRWKDRNNVYHPLRNTLVKIINLDDGSVVGSTYTNDNGYYVCSFSASASNVDLFVRAYTIGKNSEIMNSDYVYYTESSSWLYNVQQGVNTVVSFDITMQYNSGKAFQILQAIEIASEYAKAMRGSYLSAVEVYYPHNENTSGCYYTYYETDQSSEIGIFYDTSDEEFLHSYEAWDVIMHEYGHHIQNEYLVLDSQFLQHGFNYNLIDSTYYSKLQAVELVWGESVATIFGEMAQQYYSNLIQNIDYVADAKYTYFGESCLYPVDYENVQYLLGEACENVIVGLLWDLFDNSTNETFDYLHLGNRTLWNMLTTTGVTSLTAFCQEYISTYTSMTSIAKLGQLLSQYMVSASEVNCTDDGEVTWICGVTASSFINNRFDLVFYTESSSVIMRIDNASVTSSGGYGECKSYTLSDEEKGYIYDRADGDVYVMIVEYQTNNPVTGPYYSEPREVLLNYS